MPSLLESGLFRTIAAMRIRVGTPCKPQLAKPAHGVDDAMDEFSGANERRKKRAGAAADEGEEEVSVLAERKYDGMRAQIHLLDSGDDVLIYSRNCENVTARFPDVVDTFKGMMTERASLRGSIFDCEVVAIDRESGKLRAFQDLSSRSRGGGGGGGDAKPKREVDVCVMLFDCLRAGADSLVDRPLAERRGEIARLLPDLDAMQGRVQMAHSRTFVVSRAVGGDGDDDANAAARAEIDAFFRESLEQQCEGLMFKRLAGPGSVYAPGSRTSWLKLKRDYCESGRDTLDLVPIGAWYGNGRKAGWFSPFLMACYNPETETYESLCRCMSGFSDEFYKAKTEFYKDGRLLESAEKPIYVDTNESCSVWFQPTEVWEIVGADYTLSPVHTAANALMGDDGRGIGLRFPRFVREREDKGVEDATEPEAVYDLFLAQSRRADGS